MRYFPSELILFAKSSKLIIRILQSFKLVLLCLIFQIDSTSLAGASASVAPAGKPGSNPHARSEATMHLGAEMSKAIDQRFEYLRLARRLKRENDITDIVSRFIQTPADFAEVKVLLKSAGFKIEHLEAAAINGSSALIGVGKEYSITFGLLYQPTIVIGTAVPGKESEVRSIKGSIIQLTL